eukprot:5219648-Prymnesium_polylepis.1
MAACRRCAGGAADEGGDADGGDRPDDGRDRHGHDHDRPLGRRPQPRAGHRRAPQAAVCVDGLVADARAQGRATVDRRRHGRRGGGVQGARRALAACQGRPRAPAAAEHLRRPLSVTAGPRRREES